MVPGGAAKGQRQRAALGGVVAALLALGGCLPASGPELGPRAPVRVLGSWEGPELEAFRAMVAPFEQRTGLRVEYRATRDLEGVLSTSIAAGDLPDLAGVPGPGFLLKLARAGHLVDLTGVIDVGTYKRDMVPNFVDLGTVDGKLVGVFIKGTVKGLMWYDPKVYRLGPPATWAELEHRAMMTANGTRPWCVGLGSGASSGWPGTDWIEDFLLRQSGPEAYDAWVAGTLPWTSPEVRRAFLSYASVVADGAVAGGTDGALRRHFADAGDGLFSDPPECLFMHQASFITSYLDESVKRLGGSYDMLPFPDIDPRHAGSLIAAGDLFALVHDRPGARELLRYLITPEAQQIWVSKGGALSGNLRVTAYPDDISRREAALLSNAPVIRFDASDSMPEAMSAAFLAAVLEYTAEPRRLDPILRHLDAVQGSAYE
jgi:alpha-glucoside transport system substrate-binding protein